MEFWGEPSFLPLETLWISNFSVVKLHVFVVVVVVVNDDVAVDPSKLPLRFG